MANGQGVQDVLKLLGRSRQEDKQQAPIAVPTTITTKGVTGEIFQPDLELIKQQTEDLLNSRGARDLINGLFEFADETIPAQDTGRQAVVSGLTRGVTRTNVARLFGMGDESARDFALVKEAFGTLIARGLGERGVVTNKDVARVLKAMPREDDTTEGRARRKRFVNNLLGQRVTNYNKTLDKLRKAQLTIDVPQRR